MKRSHQIILIIMAIIALMFTIPAASQTFLLEVNPVATFYAYQCRFDRDTNSSQIRATLTGADGLPIPRDAYNVTVNVVETGNTPVSPALIRTTVVPERPPLYMILNLDTTNTVPIESFVNAISDGLVSQLQLEDRVALITFAEGVSPRTQFYTDKNRLLNEHMIDLRPGEGDNRLYDAIFEGLTEFPPDTNARKIVLSLTDSNRRDIEQTTLQEIITRANRERVQTYTIGINSGVDEPDTLELEELAAQTGGYVWVWDDVFISRAGIQEGVTDLLGEFIETLNTEVIIEVGLEGQRLGASGFITYQIEVETNNDDKLIHEITCPIEELFSDIQFVGDISSSTIQGPVDLNVVTESDLDDNVTSIRFIVDGAIVQEGNETVYRFNGTDNPAEPGYHIIGAELVSNTGEVLATTGTAREFYVQADVDVNIAGGYTGQLEGETVFEVRSDPNFQLPPVGFVIAEQINPADQRPLTPEPIPFNNGVAVLVISDIRSQVDRLFPNSTEEIFVVSAQVTGPSSADPNAAVSNLFEVYIPREPAPVEEAIEFTAPPQVNFRILYWALFMGLFVWNILIFRSVGRLRVRYRIAHEDNIDLSTQLMTITVRREGVRQAHTLTKKTMKVGRGSVENDINLGDDPNISRNHAVVMWRNGYWYFSNRKRRAIARINGRRKVGFIWYKLEPITEIEIGNTLLIFHSSAQQDVSEFIKTNL